MEKYFLVFDTDFDKKQMHEHIAKVLHFPQYYGKNLDALYDCLSEIDTDTCIGIYYDKNSENYAYVKRILQVFDDIEIENRHVKVFYSRLRDNNGFENYTQLYRNHKKEREEMLLREAMLRPAELREVDSDSNPKRNKE